MTGRRFLILGFPRSGTTLLARILGAHPEISCPPETNLFSAAGRFLTEQTRVEGPHVGVLTGLGFSGVEAEEAMAPLREMLFGFHERIAAGRPVWVEKTATDVFHLETLETFLAGHVRFICLTRNPLDVIGSNIDLATTSGAQLPELFERTQGINSPHEGIARAWIERTEALDAFAGRDPEARHVLSYEDMTGDPEATLGALFAFMGLEADVEETVARAFAEPGPVGLGDFRFDGTSGLRPPSANGWRKRLPPAAAARILPLVAPLMERHGYKVPKAPRAPDREDAMRQYRLAAEFKRNRRDEGG